MGNQGIYMQKKDLKSLVTQMFDELMQEIDAQDEASKEQVVTFLQDATNTIASINDEAIDSVEHAKHAFANAYKEVAQKSLDSYAQSSEKFETLSQEYSVQINLPELTEKFSDIQVQMTDEVKRANTVITELSQKVKELEKNSNLDALTNVFNRRALIQYLEKVISKEKLKYELHLLILDIDDFKTVNDTYGHIAGDKILIFIANILHKTLRDGDKIFRYGGEEFIIILNRTSSESCLEIANRLLYLIRSNKLIYKGNSLTVTMSIGATKHHAGDTPESIIARADKALYKSKKNGKNQMNVEIITDGN